MFNVIEFFSTRHTPILDGPPGFILLAIVVALAAYLRQIAIAALAETGLIEQAKEIIAQGILSQANQRAPYPFDKTSEIARQNHIDFLGGLLDNLMRVTHKLFCGMFILGIRILVSAILPKEWAWLLSLFDTIFFACVVGFIWASWSLHRRSRDDALRLRREAIQARPQA
jgi:hypothetical protein